MNLEHIKEKIDRTLESTRKNLAPTLAEFLNLYSKYRIDGTDLSQDGDMLLFQWGTYNWGDGEYFEFDITRQTLLSEEMEQETEGIQQLHITFKFSPTAETTILANGNKWCNAPCELQLFEKYIIETDVYKWSSKSTPCFVEVNLEYV